VRLARTDIKADGKIIPLSSGMGVTADIRTGSRRIISWLLSPIMTTVEQRLGKSDHMNGWQLYTF